MKHNAMRFLSLLLALVMVIGLMPAAHVHAEGETILQVGEKVASVEANATYVICLNGTMRALTNTQGSGAWGTHTLATAACGEFVSANNTWILETAEGGYKIKNVNGYLNISRNAASLNETGHVFELVYHGDAGWAIKSLESNEYGNNLGDSGSIGGWESDGTKFDIYSVTEVPAADADPFGKLRGYWTKVSVDTETVYNATEGLFEYAFDNDLGTIWHSNWQGAQDKLTGENTFAGVIDFGAAYTINRFSFTPRQGNNSGQVTQASLYVKETEEAEWTLVAEHAAFEANGSKHDIDFDAQAVRYVKFVAERSNDGWVAVSEFDVDYIAPAHEHSYEAVVTAPTCTEGGYTTYTCECGDSYTADEVPATGHHYTILDWKDSTCTEEGVIVYSCSNCFNLHYEVDPIRDHYYLVTSTTEPTCTEAGYTTYACLNCGDSYNADEVPATGHNYEAVVTAPTCKVGGYTTYTCATCSDSYIADETDATGHTLGEPVKEDEIPATCTTRGSYTKVTYCTSCGLEYSCETVYVDPLGHNYEAVVTAPTCEAGGYTTYTCLNCGDAYTADETEALGHSYVGGSCVNCGEADPDFSTIIASGWSGYTTWVLTSDGVLTFSPTEQQLDGQTNLKNYWKVDGVLTLPWGAYAESITKVVIEEGIHDIGQMAFYALPNLVEVSLPGTIVEIRNYAFKNCEKLTTINLENVDFIREGAFYGCSALENVNFMDGVVIDDWAFTKTPVVLP